MKDTVTLFTILLALSSVTFAVLCPLCVAARDGYGNTILSEWLGSNSKTQPDVSRNHTSL